MKRDAVVLLCSCLALGACSLLPAGWGGPAAPAPAPAPLAARVPVARQAPPAPLFSGGVEIEKVPFRPGVSSATVEKLAKLQGCGGGAGAGLMSEPGPVEVYRMACDNGKVFLARCELRQCRAMR
ncbi:hypothetical protein ACFOLJ_16820 [Rugamonas sp. CCM 8940]|uniref:hypothetical protein n=1 Tax=Rugamonas sp. CCM 8940 TaxID=2765359 RepID=UPI0018F52525|nr:hypothetical protein [Rugamonas sp. CCM 8940]MBJ7311051.1 hypothetical protein [Rugamonas sp. CCM 8940]